MLGAETSGADGHDRPKVMVVEDDPDIRKILELFLTEKAFRVKSAERIDGASLTVVLMRYANSDSASVSGSSFGATGGSSNSSAPSVPGTVSGEEFTVGFVSLTKLLPPT